MSGQWRPLLPRASYERHEQISHHLRDAPWFLSTRAGNLPGSSSAMPPPKIACCRRHLPSLPCGRYHHRRDRIRAPPTRRSVQKKNNRPINALLSKRGATFDQEVMPCSNRVSNTLLMTHDAKALQKNDLQEKNKQMCLFLGYFSPSLSHE